MVVFNDSTLLSEGQILEGKYHRYKVGKLIGKGSSARIFSEFIEQRIILELY